MLSVDASENSATPIMLVLALLLVGPHLPVIEIPKPEPVIGCWFLKVPTGRNEDGIQTYKYKKLCKRIDQPQRQA